MAKILKAAFPNNCIGCELCVFETQRQLNKLGLEGSLIRVLKKLDHTENSLEYQLAIDPKINDLDIEKIKNICPKAVFAIEEQDEHELIS
jgi:hypothetical protein